MTREVVDAWLKDTQELKPAAYAFADQIGDVIDLWLVGYEDNIDAELRESAVRYVRQWGK